TCRFARGDPLRTAPPYELREQPYTRLVENRRANRGMPRHRILECKLHWIRKPTPREARILDRVRDTGAVHSTIDHEVRAPKQRLRYTQTGRRSRGSAEPFSGLMSSRRSTG